MTGGDASGCLGLMEDAAVAVLAGQPVPAHVLAHADRCPGCRDELAELVPLPALLGLARDGRLVARAEPSPLLLPRLLAEVRHRRARRRWTTVAAAAAAAGIAVGSTLVIQLARTEGSGPAVAAGVLASPGVPVPTGTPGSASPAGSISPPSAVSSGEATDLVSGAQAEVKVFPIEWGSRVEVEVYSVPPRTQCRMVVVDRQGHRTEAGSWTVPAKGYDSQTFPETVMTRPKDIVAVELVDVRTKRVMMHIKVA